MDKPKRGFENTDVVLPKDNAANDGVVQANRTAEGSAPNRDHHNHKTDKNALPVESQKPTDERKLIPSSRNILG